MFDTVTAVLCRRGAHPTHVVEACGVTSFGRQAVSVHRLAVSAGWNAAGSASTGERAACVESAAAVDSGSLVRAIWPLLLAAFVCTLPYPASNIFVGSLASDFGIGAAVIGGMRGLGGAAALLVGFGVAPLLDRFPRAWTVGLGLIIVVAASLLPLAGSAAALGS